MLDSIRELLHRKPFQQFRILLTSGEAYEVTRRDQIALGQTQFTVYISKSNQWEIPRADEIVSVELSPTA